MAVVAVVAVVAVNETFVLDVFFNSLVSLMAALEGVGADTLNIPFPTDRTTMSEAFLTWGNTPCNSTVSTLCLTTISTWFPNVFRISEAIFPLCRTSRVLKILCAVGLPLAVNLSDMITTCPIVPVVVVDDGVPFVFVFVFALAPLAPPLAPVFTEEPTTIATGVDFTDVLEPSWSTKQLLGFLFALALCFAVNLTRTISSFSLSGKTVDLDPALIDFILLLRLDTVFLEAIRSFKTTELFVSRKPTCTSA